ncbi:MAG: hypothetical protein EA405_14580 [Rhodospirillales bacterium]|nr:MAG: hypothetical protein EA405_14580 [Rhodospirillales bacterium]
MAVSTFRSRCIRALLCQISISSLVLVGLIGFAWPAYADGASAPYLGGGVFIRDDGVRAYFILGSFHDEPDCRRQVKALADRITAHARWVRQRLSYRLEPCAVRFPDGTMYRNLQDVRGIGHYVLLHGNIRIAVVDRNSADKEKEACERLTEYMRHLFGGQALCAMPHPDARRTL